MYFADFQPAWALAALEIVPFQIRNFQLIRPSAQDICWMQQALDRESRRFGAGVILKPDGQFVVSWNQAP